MGHLPVFASLSDRLTSTFKNLRSRGRLSQTDIDATVREIRRALLDADVAPVDNLCTLVPLAQWAVFSEPGLAVWADGLTTEAALRKALAQGAEHAVVTLGEHGLLHACANALTKTPTFAVQAVDTTGAGDVFHAALTLALARRIPVPEALTYASAAAALKCTRAGGVRGAPDAQEVADFLRLNHPHHETRKQATP